MQDRAPPSLDCRLTDLSLSADAVGAALESLVWRCPDAIFGCAERDPVLSARLVAACAASGIAKRPLGLRRLKRRFRGPALVAFVDTLLSTIYQADRPTPWSLSGQVLESLRRYASGVAIHARYDAARSEASDPEATHLAALLESLGMFPLAYQHGGAYRELLVESTSRGDLSRRERARFGTDHRAIRRELASSWGLPLWVAAPVRSLPGGAYIARAISECWPIFDSQQAADPSQPPADPPCANVGYRLTPETAAALVRLVSDHERLQAERSAELEREKIESLAEFAAGAGHEINNPLAVIYGRAQLLLAGETDPERRRALLTMGTQAMRIHEMIADVMLFARPPEPRPEQVELAPLVTEAITALSSRTAERGVTLRFQPPAIPIEAWADAVQVRVVLANLLTNCLEALTQGGTVEVALTDRKRQRRSTLSSVLNNGKNGSSPKNGTGDSPPFLGSNSDIQATPGNMVVERFAVLRVTDDGPGISDEVRRHLFDPFYSGRQAGRGLGLGLAKCWQIVKAHGGTIQVKSRPGHGTAFTVLLPVSAPTDSAPSPHFQATE